MLIFGYQAMSIRENAQVVYVRCVSQRLMLKKVPRAGHCTCLFLHCDGLWSLSACTDVANAIDIYIDTSRFQDALVTLVTIDKDHVTYTPKELLLTGHCGFFIGIISFYESTARPHNQKETAWQSAPDVMTRRPQGLNAPPVRSESPGTWILSEGDVGEGCRWVDMKSINQRKTGWGSRDRFSVTRTVSRRTVSYLCQF